MLRILIFALLLMSCSKEYKHNLQGSWSVTKQIDQLIVDNDIITESEIDNPGVIWEFNSNTVTISKCNSKQQYPYIIDENYLIIHQDNCKSTWYIFGCTDTLAIQHSHIGLRIKTLYLTKL